MNRELFRFDEISIRGLVMDLLHNAWMILAAGLSLWLLATGWHNLTYQPEYTSSATLVVTLKGESNTYSSLSMASQMADVFSQVFQSDALRDRIVEDTGEEVSARISCTPVTETNLMVLDVSSPDPRQAYLFINSALKNYEDVAGDVFSNSALQIVQDPEVPEAPSNTSWAISHRYMLVLLAMAGMAGVICLFYLIRFTVKTPAAASRQLDGKVRGVIPYEQTGKDGTKYAPLLNSPLVTMPFTEAARRVETRIEYHLRKKQAQTLLVTSVLENEGKSTVAANLALALAEKHRKVLLIDGDLLKPAMHKLLQERQGDTPALSDALSGEADIREALHYNEECRFWELFQYRGLENPSAVMDSEKLKQWIRAWKKEMDYIIVDCSPAAVSTDAEVWMNVVDSVLLVVKEDYADVRTINDTVDAVWQSGKDFAGFVLNAFHREWFWGMDERRYGGYGYGGSQERN